MGTGLAVPRLGFGCPFASVSVRLKAGLNIVGVPRLPSSCEIPTTAGSNLRAQSNGPEAGIKLKSGCIAALKPFVQVNTGARTDQNSRRHLQGSAHIPSRA
jgi:hypothetical protein